MPSSHHLTAADALTFSFDIDDLNVEWSEERREGEVIVDLGDTDSEEEEEKATRRKQSALSCSFFDASGDDAVSTDGRSVAICFVEGAMD